MNIDDRRNLFVYGTLMRSAAGSLGAEERHRLMREATWLGAAQVQGWLYDLGGYPGVVLVEDRWAKVQGELMRLADPEAVFAWLDPYEEVSPGGSPSDLYRRIMTQATRADGTRVGCWIYELRGAPRGLKPRPDGRWRSIKPTDRLGSDQEPA